MPSARLGAQSVLPVCFPKRPPRSPTLTPLIAACSKPVQAMHARQKAIVLMNQAQADEALTLARSAVDLDRSAGILPVKSLLTEGFVHYVRGEYDLSAACWKRSSRRIHRRLTTMRLQCRIWSPPLHGKNISAKDIVPLRAFMKTVQQRIQGTRGRP